MSEPDFELDGAYDRGDLAAIVEGIATALDRDRTLRLQTAEKRLAVDFPARISAELEAVSGDGESPVAKLELELEWDDPDGSSIRTASRDDETTTENAESVAIGSEPPEDPAAATIPPEAVTDRGRSADEAVDAGGPDAERTSRFEVYQDRADEWRWRLVHWNGNIIADSGEGYASRSNAKRAVNSVMRVAPAATVEDLES